MGFSFVRNSPFCYTFYMAKGQLIKEGRAVRILCYTVVKIQRMINEQGGFMGHIQKSDEHLPVEEQPSGFTQREQAKAPHTHPIPPQAFQNGEQTVLYWLGGAGFLLNCRGTVIIIDPVLMTSPTDNGVSELGMRLLVPLPILAEEILQATAILYTHTDQDHLAPQTAQALAQTAGVYAGTNAVLARLTELGIPEDHTQMLRIGETVQFGSVAVTPTIADHGWQVLDPERYGPPHGPEDCCGFLMETPDGIIWLTGDTRFLPEHLEMGPVDVLLIDVSDDPYHLGHEKEIALANHYDKAMLVPCHYGCYDARDALPFNGDPARLAPWITNADQRLLVLAPGEPLRLRL
jgi:L-ascorbate metabolism protein UlaG (beta-lactamase superfamily)